MPLVNLTPHPVTVYAADGRVVLRRPAAEEPVRLRVRREDDGEVEGVPVVVEHRGRAALPAAEPGVSLIVSYPVALAHPERDDLLVPADLVRSAEGTVVGCRAFSKIAATCREMGRNPPTDHPGAIQRTLGGYPLPE